MSLFHKLASSSRLSLASTLRPSTSQHDDQAAAESSMWADDLDGADSKSLAGSDDNASIFSFTPTLVGRTGVLTYSNQALVNAPDPLPGSELYASFVANYEGWTPKASLFVRHGLPARVKRGQNKSLLTKLIKSIIVQFPLRILNETGYHPHPRTMEDISRRRQAHQRTRNLHGMGTVWAFEAIDLTGIREKDLMGLVLGHLLKADDVHNAHLIYPPEMLRRTAPKNLLRKDGSVVVDAKWATLRVLSPALATNSEEAWAQGKGKDNADRYGLVKESDEQLLERLFEPDHEAERALDMVLEHLERRGGIWTHAGHFTATNSKNKNPQKRPEFTIHGLFPTTLLNRFKKYRANDRMPMPSDLADEKAAQTLVLYTLAERLGNLEESKSTAEEDVLEGWSVAVTEEPYRTSRGRWMNPGPYGTPAPA